MKRILSIALMTAILGGCCKPQVTFIESKWPILPRPTLKLDPVTANDVEGCGDDALRRLRDRDQRLKEHILTLEVAIDEYNIAAREHNARIRKVENRERR